MRRQIGVAIVGAGRIGTLRARLASQHPAVHSIVIVDRDRDAAVRLADSIGAEVGSDDHDEAIAHDDVDAVIVSTSEGEHTDIVLDALRHGRHVLVEKPIALTLAEADRIIEATATSTAELRVGYTRRFRRRYQVAKEQIVQQRLGTLIGATARVYNSRAQALAMLSRNPDATPVVDALTYYVDLMNWFFADRRLIEVTAMGQRGVLEDAGHATDDLTWAILRYDDGAVINLGVCYALPARYPALGHAARVELIGSDGVILIDDDHTDQVMYTDVGVPHVYLSEHEVNSVFLSSGTPGDWALDDFVGPLAAETRSWLDHLTTDRPCILATAQDARATLEATLAIERASSTGTTIDLRIA